MGAQPIGATACYTSMLTALPPDVNRKNWVDWAATPVIRRRKKVETHRQFQPAAICASAAGSAGIRPTVTMEEEPKHVGRVIDRNRRHSEHVAQNEILGSGGPEADVLRDGQRCLPNLFPKLLKGLRVDLLIWLVVPAKLRGATTRPSRLKMGAPTQQETNFRFLIL